MTQRRSPLHEQHVKLKAKMVPFGGWEMPLSYPSGTLSEHRACRSGAVAFDVSHLGTVRLEGPGSFEQLQSALTNDLSRIAPGRAQYTHLLDESDASVLDDIIVWWVADDRFDVMPNASNTQGVLAAIGGEDVTGGRAVIAIQGPSARKLTSEVSSEAAEVARFAVRQFEWRKTPCIAAGTGYTGEDGIECAVPAEIAPQFWSGLIDAGIAPAGLGARDTLRLEAALPLHGHELGPGITPLQANLNWVVAWNKKTFRGREALLAEKNSGPSRRLCGLEVEGRQPPRQGYRVLLDGEPRGWVTSGNFSPILEKGIALAFLPPGEEIGRPVEIEMRNQLTRGRIVGTPFVSKTVGATG